MILGQKEKNKEVIKKEKKALSRKKRMIIAGVPILAVVVIGVLLLSSQSKEPAYEDDYLVILQYKGLKVDKVTKVEVTEEAIEERLEQVIAAEAEYAGIAAGQFVFDDGYVASMQSEDYSNLSEFKEFLGDTLEAENEDSYIDAVSAEVFDILMTSSTVKAYPEGIVEKYQEEIKEDDEHEAEEGYSSFDEYIRVIYDVTSTKEYEVAVKESAEYLAKRKMITDAIFNKEGLNYTNEQMEKIYESYAAAYNVSVEEIKSEEWSEWMTIVLDNKENWTVCEYLVKVSKMI